MESTEGESLKLGLVVAQTLRSKKARQGYVENSRCTLPEK